MNIKIEVIDGESTYNINCSSIHDAKKFLEDVEKNQIDKNINTITGGIE